MKNSFLAREVYSFEENQIPEAPDFPGSVYAATGSMKGEILLQWDAVRDASKYIIQISKKNSAESTWEQYDIVKDPLYCITGLKPGKVYSFRVAAVYQGCIGRWSGTVTKKVK